MDAVRTFTAIPMKCTTWFLTPGTQWARNRISMAFQPQFSLVLTVWACSTCLGDGALGYLLQGLSRSCWRQDSTDFSSIECNNSNWNNPNQEQPALWGRRGVSMHLLRDAFTCSGFPSPAPVAPSPHPTAAHGCELLCVVLTQGCSSNPEPWIVKQFSFSFLPFRQKIQLN